MYRILHIKVMPDWFILYNLIHFFMYKAVLSFSLFIHSYNFYKILYERDSNFLVCKNIIFEFTVNESNNIKTKAEAGKFKGIVHR